MLPLLALLGFGAAAAAAAAVASSSSSSSSSSSGPGTFKRVPLTRSSSEPIPTPEEFVNQAIGGAAAYAELLAEASAIPSSVSNEELERLGREFKEGKERLEKDTLKQWDRTVDAYAGAIEAGLQKTGVGTLINPLSRFIYGQKGINQQGYAFGSYWRAGALYSAITASVADICAAFAAEYL